MAICDKCYEEKIQGAVVFNTEREAEAVFRKGPLRKLRQWYLSWDLTGEKELAKWWEGEHNIVR